MRQSSLLQPYFLHKSLAWSLFNLTIFVYIQSKRLWTVAYLCLKTHTVPFWQIHDTHRGPVHLSLHWHSSYKEKRTSSSIEHSWPALAPCMRKSQRLLLAQSKLRYHVLGVCSLWTQASFTDFMSAQTFMCLFN